VETRKSEPVIPESYEDLLASTAVAHIATIGPHGEPQNNPVWFGWDGEHLMFSQTKTRQKYRNIKRDPRIAVSIVDPENHLRYLEVRGEVVRIDEDPDLEFINSMAKKYLGLDKYPYHQPGDERVVIVIEPRHATYMN
jgi:PPOX class probable F420-dependent enzyme